MNINMMAWSDPETKLGLYAFPFQYLGNKRPSANQ